MKSKEKHPLRDTLVIVGALALGLVLGVGLTALTEMEESVPAVTVAEELSPDRGETKKNDTVPETPPAEEISPEPLVTTADTDSDEVILDPPTENIGGIGNPAERVADGEGAPEEVIENCSEFYAQRLGEASQLGTKEGPVRAGFTVEFDGLLSEWALMTISKLPEDLLDVIVVDAANTNEYTFKSDHGEIVDTSARALTWKAPEEPGIYCVRILENGTDKQMCLHVAVMKPWDGESETLNGYKIGKYQDIPFRGNPRYKKPRGFIEVTEENLDTWLSPHLQLKQFVCKQQSSFPKYMLVDTRLLMKLETLVAKLEETDRDASHLYISSGFRTPAYNVALGNTTSYSRHLYGDAADLFVDANRDGKLDDLDFDGAISDDDAVVLKKAVESVGEAHRHLQGGLGFYSSANYRNPFLHIDTRGYQARWNK